MEFSKEITKFIISEGAQHQVEIIDLTELLRDELFPDLPHLASARLTESLEVLKPNFNTDDEYEKYVRNEIRQTLGSFNKAIWSSLFSYSFFNLERDLNSLCKKIEKEIQSNITLGNLSGRGIDRSKLFLKKLAEVDFEQLNDNWQNIIIYKEIRNCISHNANSIKKSNRQAELREYISSNGGISIEEDIISISPAFIVSACDINYDFWLGIGNQLIPEDADWA